MVLNRHRGSVTFWAWLISIVFHLIVLTVFGFIELSKPKAQSGLKYVPTAKVSEVRKLMERTAVVPKPKVKKRSPSSYDSAGTGAGGFERKSEYSTSRNEIFKVVKTGLGDFSIPYKSTNRHSGSLGSDGFLSRKVGLFGSWTDERKICYIVDCSGSMKGMMGRVRENLTESIAALEPDYFFYVIFFGEGRLFELGGGKLVRATEQAKKDAYHFIEAIKAGGQTNAFEALKRAVQIGEGYRIKPSIFYFLTDGFELANGDISPFCGKTAELMRQYAPTAKLNTIGFWPVSRDREILRIIAEQSGGECMFITE